MTTTCMFFAIQDAKKSRSQGMNMSSSDVPWQLCQSLLDLQEAVDRVFNTIVTRVNMEHEQLKNLVNRIQLAQDKVKAISLSKQATTVFSSTKYPNLPSEALDFTPLFGNDSEPLFVKLSPHLGCCGESGEGTLELFRFFMETNEEHWFNSQKIKEGIRSLPPEVKCLPDIMLYNSTELPFHRSADNLGEMEAQQADYNHRKTATKLPAPPQSILESNTSLLTSSGRQEYGFRPVLRQVPTFSLPATLPNLPMVANISWNDGSKLPFDGVSYISPSATYGPSPGAMETSSTSILVSGPSIQMDALNVSAGRGQDAEPSTSLVKAPFLSSTAANKEALNGKDYSPPRPPPMPPVPGPGSSVRIIPEGKLQGNSLLVHPSAPMEAIGPSLPPVDSQRAALMASIRNPEIVLRKTSFTDDSLSQHPIKDLHDGEQPSPSRKQAGDFLAEMAASLKMRRLSMQGHSTNKSPDLDANSKDRNPAYPESRRRTISPLPIMNFRDFILKEDNDSGDDWDDNSD